MTREPTPYQKNHHVDLIEVGKDEEAKRSLSKSNKVSVDDPALLAEYDTIKAGELKLKSWQVTHHSLNYLSTKTKVFQRVLMGVMITIAAAINR
ncbi:ASN_collapsed_G0028100.mRNA.1.CDS.1 [Saccharomyces cerevisiae]|nr:ASN_collapsed_G0028100.mRNA.1.CDS.1 [Saccharomyces cerevisiae]